MFKLLILIIAVCSIGGCATNTPYTDWSKKEQTLYKYQLALQTIDTVQAIRVMKCQEASNMCPLVEANPIIGSRLSTRKLIGAKLISNMLLYRILTLNNTHRERIIKFANGGLMIIVSRNQIMINKVL